MLVWIFVISLMMPSFGGPVHVTVDATTEDGCQRLRKVITREMDKLSTRYDVTECGMRPEAK